MMTWITLRRTHPNQRTHDHPPEVSRPRTPSKDLMMTWMTKRLLHRAASQNGKATHIQRRVKTTMVQQVTKEIPLKKTLKKKAYLDTDRSASQYMAKSSTGQSPRMTKRNRRQTGSTTHTTTVTR